MKKLSDNLTLSGRDEGNFYYESAEHSDTFKGFIYTL